MRQGRQRVLYILSIIVISVLIGLNMLEAGETFPAKPVTILVPWPPGGATDTLARGFEKVMPKYLPQPLVVVNKPGGAGTIATTELVRSKPDGYTICLNAIGPLTTQPHLTNLPYGKDDYEVIIHIGNNPIVLAVQETAPWKNLSDLVTYMKANPEKVRIGHHGAGSIGHLALVEWQGITGLSFLPIPFSGGAPLATALLGGHIEAAALHPAEILAHVEAGKARVIGVMQPERNPQFPEAPTFKELGYSIEAGIFNIILAPKGTPPDRLQILHDAFKQALEDPEFVALTERVNYNRQYLDGETARQKLAVAYDKYGELIKRLGLAKK